MTADCIPFVSSAQTSTISQGKAEVLHLRLTVTYMSEGLAASV
jgi:hypothetical protein